MRAARLKRWGGAAGAGWLWLAGGRAVLLAGTLDGWMDGGHRIAFIGEILLQHRHIRL